MAALLSSSCSPLLSYVPLLLLSSPLLFFPFLPPLPSSPLSSLPLLFIPISYQLVCIIECSFCDYLTVSYVVPFTNFYLV